MFTFVQILTKSSPSPKTSGTFHQGKVAISFYFYYQPLVFLRPGDADGPLLLPMAELKRMLGFTRAQAHIEEFRAQGRTEVRDGVEYLAFPVWKDLGRP